VETGVLAVTGASGFLGWHLRVLARSLGLPAPVLVERADLENPRVLDGVDRVVHLAGINRGDPDRVARGNVEIAESLIRGLSRCATPPKTVVFANSVQAGNGTPYGDGKAAAAALIGEATRWSGSRFVDVRLPNVFGEHGRPHYNSVIATFCRTLADGGAARVDEDRSLDLLHATDAAARLLEMPDTVATTRRSVRDLAETLTTYAQQYRAGEIPALTDRFAVRLFNTYRSHCPVVDVPLPKHSDARGDLVEAVKAHGGGGQSFVSSTVPGVTRGDHFHLSKVERFAVLRGTAEICLRRLHHRPITRILVHGEDPAVVDMPTMWAHSITNVGDDELLTLFWANEVFDPADPDTYPEQVT
jgi:UDP-2-acetamido-2,6-beta-L-arabino-hexul-4-ose reductase